ncbi:hypothetical protein ALC56_05320, partial [Trachymyrmex septentrionalis]
NEVYSKEFKELFNLGRLLLFQFDCVANLYLNKFELRDTLYTISQKAHTGIFTNRFEKETERTKKKKKKKTKKKKKKKRRRGEEEVETPRVALETIKLFAIPSLPVELLPGGREILVEYRCYQKLRSNIAKIAFNEGTRENMRFQRDDPFAGTIFPHEREVSEFTKNEITVARDRAAILMEALGSDLPVPSATGPKRSH